MVTLLQHLVTLCIFAVTPCNGYVTAGNEAVTTGNLKFIQKMRFYKNRQAEMLHGVSRFLHKNNEKLSSKVPAMKDFIDEFLKKEHAVYAVKTGNPNLVLM